MQSPTNQSTQDPRALALQAVDLLSDMKAVDIILLDVRRVTYFADYFVIASATSERQLGALAERLDAQTSAGGIKPYHIEGTADSGWMLVDYGHIVVHLFTEATRDYYRLEKVWAEATTVLRVL